MFEHIAAEEKSSGAADGERLSREGHIRKRKVKIKSNSAELKLN